MNFTPKDVAILVLAIILIIALYISYKKGFIQTILPDVWSKLQSLFDGGVTSNNVNPN